MYADDYVAEADALADMYDGMEDFDNEDCTSKDRSWLYGGYFYSKRKKKRRNKKSLVPRDKAGRVKQLADTGIEDIRAANKVAAVKSTCICPICKSEFIKRTYQQTFCCPDCHAKYHNLRYK